MNNIRTRTFIWAKGKRANWSDGWQPEDAPSFDPGGPVHMAHDMVEHMFNRESFEGELIAFGATIFGRGHANDIQMVTSSQDLSAFLEKEHYSVPKPRARWAKLRLDYNAERLLALLFANSDMREVAKMDIANDVRTWIRLGYKMAERIYGKGRQEDIDDAFDHIRNALARFMFFKSPSDGDRLEVKFNRKTLDVSFEYLDQKPAVPTLEGTLLPMPKRRINPNDYFKEETQRAIDILRT